MPLAAARAALLVLAVAGAEGFGSVPSGSPRRVSVERTTAAQRADLITATRRLKQTPSPWARGLDASGRRVPRRWHNLTWYDTFVVIHLTNYVENSFAHMGPAFPSWHRLMIDLLEDALNEVLPEPERTAGPGRIMQPYWDWTRPAATKLTFSDAVVGGDGHGHCITGPYQMSEFNITWANVYATPAAGAPMYGAQFGAGCISRQIATFGATFVRTLDSVLPTRDNVLQLLQLPFFDTWPFDQGSWGALSFRNVLEGWGGPQNRGAATNTIFRTNHNQVHIWIGGTMADTASPNDPVFFLHHTMVDRLYETWLTSSNLQANADPSDGYPTVVGASGETTPYHSPTSIPLHPDSTLVLGYPAYVAKFDAECSSRWPDVSVWLAATPGLGMEIHVNLPIEQLAQLVETCGRQKFGAGAGLTGGSLTTYRFIVGFDKGSEYAADIPPPEEAFIDQTAFEATIAGREIVYESFSFVNYAMSADLGRSTLLSTRQFTYDRQLGLRLAKPDWHVDSPATVDGPCSERVGPNYARSAFANQVTTTDFCRFHKLVAVTEDGNGLDLHSWTPQHYWAPGVTAAIQDLPLVLNFEGDSDIPTTSCLQAAPGAGSPTDLDKCEVQFAGEFRFAGVTAFNFTSPMPGNLSSAQTKQLMAYARMGVVGDSITCRVFAGAAEAGMSAAPSANGKICELEVYLIDNPLLTPELNQERNTRAQSPEMRATVFASAELQPSQNTSRPRATLPHHLDVTDNIYLGARPGHNAQDLMFPFAELNLKHSPAEYFKPSGKYDALFE